MTEQLQKEIRGYLFTNNDISDKLKDKLSKEHVNVNIDELILKAKREITPSNVSGQLVPKATIENWNNKIKKIEDGLSANDKNFGIKTEFEKLKNRSYKDDNEALLCIKHLEERAKIQKNRNPVFSGVVKDFAADCQKFYIDDKQKLFSFFYKDCINDIEKQIHSFIAAGSFQFHQYVQLAEDTYFKYKTEDKYREDSELFRKILGIIHGICSLQKIEIPVFKIATICPKCGDEGQTGAICVKCGAYIKCPGCKHTIVKDAKICGGCGVEIENMDAWLGKIKDADKKIAAGDYESAEQLINPVKTIWASNEHVTTLVNSIAELRAKVDDCEKKVNECMAKAHYFAAQRQIDDIKGKVLLPDSFHAKEKVIGDRIEQARILVDTGDKQYDHIQKIDSYSQAISLVADFDEVINKLKHQNIHVTNLDITTNERQVELRWDNITCNALNIKYIIYREDVTNHKAETEIKQTSNPYFIDTVECGISYIYHIKVQYNISGTDISDVFEDEAKSREIIVPVKVREERDRERKKEKDVPPPKGDPLNGGSSKKIIVGIIAAVFILGGGISAYFFLSSDTSVKELKPGESQVESTAGQPATTPVVTKEEDKTKAPEDNDLAAILNAGHVTDNGDGTGTIKTSYGNYTGDLKKGKANGNGMFQFFKSFRISHRDGDRQRVSESGDYLVGQFKNNEAIQVEWYDKGKKHKETIRAGN